MLSSRRTFIATFAAIGIFSVAGAADGQLTDAQLGCELRRLLGYGPREMTALGVDLTTYRSIATTATTYCNQHRATIEPLVTAAANASQAAARAYQSGSGIDAADGDLISALDALVAGAAGAITALDGLLSTDQRTQHARVFANWRIGAPLTLLDLTSEQRATLRAAQKARDQVLLNQRQRKDSRAMQAAQETFDTAVNGCLTSEQKTQLAAYRAAQQSHCAAAIQMKQHDEGLGG